MDDDEKKEKRFIFILRRLLSSFTVVPVWGIIDAVVRVCRWLIKIGTLNALQVVDDTEVIVSDSNDIANTNIESDNDIDTSRIV